MAALQAAMDAQLGKDEPAAPPAAADAAVEPQIPPEFAQALQISDFVRAPEHVEQAVRAADEVWKVASGQAPASGLLEGMRAANPEGFKAVIGDLIPYIEQITGRAFTDQPNKPPDPNQARLDRIEQQFAAQQTERQNAMLQQQVSRATELTAAYLAKTLKGTFAEGQEQRFMALMGQHLGDRNKVMQEVLSGDTKSIEKAFRAAKAQETEALRAYNANLVKQHRALADAVPATKGSNRVRTPSSDAMKPLPGETTAQTVKRLLQG
jgi:hypothetical protein